MEDSILEEWQELLDDYKQLETVNEKYKEKLSEITSLQSTCLKHIAHQRYRMQIIFKRISQLPKHQQNEEKLVELKNNILKREAELTNVELTLPKPRSTYLSIVLGSVDVSILNKEDKYKYKDEYEKFKLISHMVAFVLASVSLAYHSRIFELLYAFFLVWYYCTLTIRESILKANGSKIKGWWRFHHVLSTIASGVVLVFPTTEIWEVFRYQFYRYNIFTCLVQYLQFRYQRGTLYRLKALGQRDNMDITIEGFHFWMWRGLTFLLPFLFLTYVYQLYHSITLFNLRNHPEATWHVYVLSILFFSFFMGNTLTTLMVLPNKVKQKMFLKLSSIVKTN